MAVTLPRAICYDARVRRGNLRPVLARLITFLLLTGLLAASAWASESPPVVTPRASATLITESDSMVAGGQVRIALRLRLADGWHTYWHNPGEAGVPIELTPTLSPGATAGPLEWPAPRRISEGDITHVRLLRRDRAAPSGRSGAQRHIGVRAGRGALAGVQGHLRAGGSDLPTGHSRRLGWPFGSGGIVRAARSVGAAAVALVPPRSPPTARCSCAARS